MNFVILGAGAIGCYVGGKLAAGGRRVTLVGRPKTVALLAGTGLTLSDLDGLRTHVPARQLHVGGWGVLSSRRARQARLARMAYATA